MTDMLTVSEVSRTYGVSARMLRHYEKLGLIGSNRKEGYAYRVYRPEDIQRLRQILVLRKLRLSLKEIGAILNDPGPATAISVFEKNLAEMDEELRSLGAVRDVIGEFCNALKQRSALPAGEMILQDSRLLALADELSPSSTLIQEERKSIMDNLKQADQGGRMTVGKASRTAAVRLQPSDPDGRHRVPRIRVLDYDPGRNGSAGSA